MADRLAPLSMPCVTVVQAQCFDLALCDIMLPELDGFELLPYMKVVQNKGKILVCKPCAATRMIGEDDLPTGFAISTGVALIEPEVLEQIQL